MQKLDKAEIHEIAKQKLSEGIPKQQVFDELLSTYPQSKEVARIVENIPSKRARKKYAGWNILLLILFIIIGGADLINMNVVGLIIDVLFIVAIVGYKVKYYQWISIRAVMTIIVLAASVSTNELSMIVIVPYLFDLAIAITLLVLGLWLSAKLCPSPLIKKEIYTNKAGQRRMRYLYNFQEE